MRRLALLTLLALLVGCPNSGKDTPPPTTGSADGAGSGATDTSDWPEWKRKLLPEDDSWREVDQTLTFNNGAEPETLDPHLMTGVLEGRLGGALFEGLVNQHPETLQPLPGVAESWTVSDDQLTYTFTLRDSKWTNGDPVTAEDFEASWKRALTPETACQYSYMFSNIEGATPFSKGELKDWSKVGIKATDSKTLVVTLTAPCPFFLDLVAFHTLLPVPTKTIEKYGDKWSRPEHIVGNGAYKLTIWKQAEKVVLVKNPDYWDADFVKIEKLIALPYENVDTAYKKFLEGEVDWITAVPSSKIAEIKEKADYYVQPYLGSYFYRVNVTKPPFDDVRVRKALSMGFDREIITRDLLKAGQIPATWFTPKMPGYEPPKGFAYDRDAAKKLLAEAGYPDGKGFPKVELLYNTNEDHKKVAEAMVQQWSENLGVTVSLRNSEWKVYLSEVENLNYSIARAGWIGDYTDPNTFLDMWLKDGGNNNTGWHSPKYDELIGKASREANSTKRMAMLREAESILVEQEFPIIPIYIYVNQGMLAEKVGGWYENVRDQHPFKYMWIAKVN